jgi:hypothetical protein
MAEASGPRFFTIEVADAKFAAGPNKGVRIENVGRYSSSNPLSAGRKAATRLYGEAKADSVVFILRETTRGSGNPHFVYSGAKKKLPAPVSYTRKSKLPDGSVKEDTITKTHENQVRAIRGENELRALYKKLDIPFPADIVDDSKTSSKKRSSKGKTASRNVGGGARRSYKKRGGGDLADTAAPVDFGAEAADASVDQEGGTAGSQCCQAAPADLSDQGHLISTGGQISAHADQLAKANQMSEAAKQAADAARAQVEAERTRILNTM